MPQNPFYSCIPLILFKFFKYSEFVTKKILPKKYNKVQYILVEILNLPMNIVGFIFLFLINMCIEQMFVRPLSLFDLGK